MATVLDEATSSLKRIQQTDAKSLARSDELPGQSNFAAVVPPAERIIGLFRQIPESILPDFPENILVQIQQQANATFSIFEQVRKFNIETGNLGQTRTQTVNQLTDLYTPMWTILHPYIGYAAARLVDFRRLETEGRSAVQSITDRTSELMAQLKATKEQADEALAAARRAATEQGVSQQAVYFRDEAALHEKASDSWRTRTTWLAIGLAAYALITVFFHKWTWMKPADALESTQLITSKILIFAVISYMLILAARNFLSHKHNAIANRHRQNALMTFNALALAAKDDAAKDIILTHAAACIFAPQETGYSKGTAPQESSLAQAMAGLLAKSETKASS